jgi:hypothetical protein
MIGLKFKKQIHYQIKERTKRVKKKEKISYEAPLIEISHLFVSDIITASAPDWNDENVDSGGWT